MKNFIWIFATIVLAFVGDRVGGWVLGKITTESNFRYSRLYGGKAECDILLMGNSRGLIFYQPYIEEKTGLETVNLSYNGMPIDLAKTLIQDHLDNYKPRQLILDISLVDKRMDQRLVNGFNLYTPYSKRLSSLLIEKNATSFYGGLFSHLYRYNGEVFKRALYYTQKSDEDWLLDRIISRQMQEDVVNIDSFNFDYDDDMLLEIKQLVSYAQSKNVDVKLVLNPYFPPFAEKLFNKSSLINDIEQVTGLEVYDYSTSVKGIDGFGDYQHLNKNGAKEFLDKLISDGIMITGN